MNPDRWRRIEAVYHGALERAPAHRPTFLSESCDGDDELRREVEALLAQSDSSSELRGPIEGGAAGLLEETALHEGAHLGPYRIETLLGAGGMGRVYKARDSRLGRAVAVKVAGKQFGERFEREARLISALNHPNICTLHDVGPNYLVMELVEGSTLAAGLRKGKLPVQTALRYAAQIADALAAAHARGIVHRDLKPGNIMITDTGLVKVLDFGLAKLDRVLPERGETLTVTEEGAIVGTVAYMSPEQAEGKKIDARSDIFNFGAVLYEMLTGRQAFQGGSKASTLSAILREEPKPLPQDIPAELERLVTRCLRKDPERRWQHMADLRVALEELKQDSEPGRLASITATDARPRRRWLWIAAPLAGASILGAWFLLRENPPPPAGAFQPVPVTSYPGTENWPTLSPDGKQVAFTWGGEKNDNPDIYVTLVTSAGSPLRLTTNEAPDAIPAWSPDGSKIAFVRQEGPGASVYLISPLGGQERKVTDLQLPPDGRSGSLCWSPDGAWLAASDRTSDRHSPGVTLIDISTGEKRYLTKPTAPDWGDLSYAFSPDGSRLVFARWANASVADLYQIPVAGGEPVRLTRRNRAIRALSWIPGSQDVAFESQGMLLRMPARPGAPITNPLGNEFIGGFSISQSARLVYSRRMNDQNIWGLAAGEPAPKQIVASTLNDFSPQLSPNGSRIAFSSNRSGPWEIWVSGQDGKNATQLTALGGQSHSARWAPDGKLLVFSCSRDDNRDIYTVRADGSALRRLRTDPVDEGRPSFSRDGKWIYFYSFRSGSVQIWKMAVEGGQTIQVTRNGGHEAQESWDGTKVYFTNFDGYILKSVAPQGGEEKVENEAIWSGLWDVTEKGIVYLAPTWPHPILLWNPDRNETKQLGVINGRLNTLLPRGYLAPPGTRDGSSGRR